MAFQPVLERMNEIGNSQAFQEFVNNSIGSISALAGVSLELVGLLTGAAGVLADNWSWLSPVIYGVAGALAVYYAPCCDGGSADAPCGGDRKPDSGNGGGDRSPERAERLYVCLPGHVADHSGDRPDSRILCGGGGGK